MTGLMNDRDAGVYKVTYSPPLGGNVFKLFGTRGRKSSGEEGNGREEA